MRNWFLMDEEKGDGAAAGGGAGAGAGGGAASGDGAAGAGAGAGSGDAGAGAAGKGAGAGASSNKGDASAGDKGNGADAGKKGAWPDDWLERVSKGDEKVAKQLGRYASPEALAEAHINLRKRMDSGEFKPMLPKNPKPEELAAWRKDNGIPASPEGYDLSELRLPKEDKEIVSGFVSKLHAKNASPDVVKEAVGAYYGELARQQQVRAEKDEQERVSVIDKLGEEWGGKFSSYRNRVENVLSTFPQSVRDAFKSARLPDGTAIFNHPDIMRGFLALSLRDIPEGVSVPAGDGDLGKSMTDRYKEITKTMREDRNAYNKDAAMQKEYKDLIAAMAKHDLIDKNGNLKERKAA